MQAGTVLDGRYRLIEPVGAGGFGQVWQAHDPKVDRLVAVKVLTGDSGADHDRQVARFAREAAVAGGLSHPRIVTVHDFGSAMHHGRPYAYLVMQLLPGTSLSALLESGPLPLPKALYMASCVADALDAAHEAGLTHRDIKPSNIMVRDNGEATVVDFGITKGSDARHDITTTGVLIGTPAYMAPEALSGTFDYRSDLYSLGCVLFETVTGRRPFTGTSWHLINQHLHEQPAPLRTLRPDAPVDLERLVNRLLAKDPAQRPESADEVYDLIEEINDRYFGDTPPPSRGADVTSEVSLTPSEATDGAVVPMRMTAHENCPACATTGDETRVLDCAVCRGEGRVASKRRTFSVRIPAGVRNGQKIRLREFGAPGKHGGAPGDLYVTVHVVD
ncbi:protein kinase [Streptomyces scabiei]|uniref:protein kinase domain-containing protein n=1 Tax=Streptomyces scabiei TaxID=1930 RepID=UPI00298F62AD|nr:protein kinase [Streptomyces scabiei]MDW8805502.1 protein kinase [Streptomyces scabiei]